MEAASEKMWLITYDLSMIIEGCQLEMDIDGSSILIGGKKANRQSVIKKIISYLNNGDNEDEMISTKFSTV